MARKPKEPKQPKQPATTDPSQMSKRRQIVETYRMSKQEDPRIGAVMILAFLVAGAIGFGLFWLLPPKDGFLHLLMPIVGGLLLGFLAMMVIFSRRAQKAAYKRLDGQPGGAARALSMLRRGWKTDEVIGFTKQQDLLHRVVGPPGIVLVGEGNPHRLRQLMTSERRKHERVAADFPIHEIIVGHDEGQVPLPKLVRHVQKLGREVKGPQMTDIINRLKALDAQRPKAPIPRGPVPTSMKGMRSQMRGR